MLSLDLACKKAFENGWFASDSSNPLQKAFAQKKAVHAGMSGTPVPQENWESVLSDLRSRPRSGQSAAYVHFPYCESMCLYCGFFGGKHSAQAGAEYLKTLLAEIEMEAAFASAQQQPIHALYLGGGTPTALQAEELFLLLTTLRRVLPLANDCEITIEGRIHNFSKDKIESCLAAGANRFSLGVQTFNTALRQMLGRIDTRETVIAKLEELASYNQAAIVIDLIYGLPGQSLDDWKNDIRTFLELPIHGVDLYQLNVFPQSALQKSIAAGKIPSTIPLHEQSAYFEAGMEMMLEARATRLSASHWGKGTRERNIYNPMAKNRSDCLNFGSRAGGALHGYFMANDSSIPAYFERCRKGEKPLALLMAPPENFPLVRTILSEMELCRLNLPALDRALAQTALAEKFFSASALFEPIFENWEHTGLVSRQGNWLALTTAGQFWHANITHALLSWQNLFMTESL